MQDPDRITDTRVVHLIEQIRLNRTILKMSIPGTGYEGLTIITGTDHTNSTPSFFIDCPWDAAEAARDTEGKRVVFEFNGEDKIQYSFRTYICGSDAKSLRIQCPNTIERIQRRKTFRITAPPGTMATVYLMDKRYDFHVGNLSEGGALLNQKDRFHDKRVLFAGCHLNDLFFENNEGPQKIRVRIKQADITRIEKNSRTGRYSYALRFTEMGKREEEEIRGFIYMCQRKMLKRRSLIEDE